MKETLKKNLIFLLSVLIFGLAWEIAAKIVDSPLVLPPLEAVFRRLCRLAGTRLFWTSLLATACRVLAAFVVTVLLGLLLGFACGLNEKIRFFLSFPLSLVKATPVVALIMVVLFWFPTKTLPVICAVLMTLPVMTDSVSKAVQNTDKKLLEMAAVFDFSLKTRLSSVYFPSVKPYAAGAARTVFAQGWKVVAAGEILALPRNAFGTLIQDNRILLEPDAVFALVLTLTLICVLSEKVLFKLFEYMGVSLARFQRARAGSFAAPASASEPSVFSVPSAPQTAPAPDAAVKIENLSFTYKGSSPEENREIFKDFSLELESGKISAISGPSGRGKTTLLNIISGIIPRDQYSGTVRSQKASFIFQDSRLIPELSVLKNTALPLFSKMTKKEAYRTAFRYLSKVGLEDRAFSPASELSGGQKQKVQAARAFAFQTPLVLMDEGTNSLDEDARENLWASIKELLSENPRTLVFVTHNKAEAEKYADSIIGL
ncbi:MAG: ATP-binding cassette domain-containing protein [Treponema sp.]|nr:ATP-binding cassette domain-containing protein [Treponema sp.]